MPTENSELVPGELFFEDAEEKDDAVDAIRYAVENTKGYTATTTFTITKEELIRMQKMLGVQRITRKRFKKLLMACGMQRNDAEIVARAFHESKIQYTPLAVQKVVETIMIETEKC